MAKEKRAEIVISTDPLNENVEQFKIYQRDGETVQVAIGYMANVPLWVAERAKEIGDIKTYKIID